MRGSRPKPFLGARLAIGKLEASIFRPVAHRNAIQPILPFARSSRMLDVTLRLVHTFNGTTLHDEMVGLVQPSILLHLCSLFNCSCSTCLSYSMLSYILPFSRNI